MPPSGPRSDTTTPENGLFLLAFFQKNEKMHPKSTANGSFFSREIPLIPLKQRELTTICCEHLPKWQVEQLWDDDDVFIFERCEHLPKWQVEQLLFS